MPIPGSRVARLLGWGIALARFLIAPVFSGFENYAGLSLGRRRLVPNVGKRLTAVDGLWIVAGDDSTLKCLILPPLPPNDP